MENFEVNALIDNSIIPSLDNRPIRRDKVCIEECTSKGDLYRCCICSVWYHVGCVNLPADEQDGFWSCHKCRYIAEEVAELRLYSQMLLKQNTQILQTLKSQQDSINSFVSLQTKTSGFLKDLEGKVEDIHNNVCDDTDNEEECDPDELEDTHIYGDSLIRDIESTEANTIVERAGPYISNVKKSIKKLPARKCKKKIVCVVGTNDASSKRPVEKIANECELLVLEAVVRADTVLLSSIPPRNDDKVSMEKIDAINEQFRNIAENTEGVEYISHDKNFRYQDGSLDSSMLLPDQLHLSSKGTKKLIENLGLKEHTISTTGKGPVKKRTNSDRGQSRRQGPFSWSSQSTQMPISNLPWKTSSSRVQDKPPLRPWPGTKNLPHVKHERYFHSGKDVLSNFYMTNLRVWDRIFKSIEHGYQWRKAMYLGLDKIAWRIMTAPTARDAKCIADDELNTRGTDWHKVKYEVMHEFLTVKAEQCPEFSETLLRSGNEHLI
jgi:predicted NAD-dependent protein-ADP-ribosyltransferase YbiA (DUF1768 family)